jgi:hypothetical protein
MPGVAIEDLLKLWSAELRKAKARLVDQSPERLGLGDGFSVFWIRCWAAEREAELMADILRNHPGLTREKAQEMLDYFDWPLRRGPPLIPQEAFDRGPRRWCGRPSSTMIRSPALSAFTYPIFLTSHPSGPAVIGHDFSKMLYT